MSLAMNGSIQPPDKVLGLPGEIAAQRKRLGCEPSVVRHDAGRRIDGKRHDPVGLMAGDFLDVHAAGGR